MPDQTLTVAQLRSLMLLRHAKKWTEINRIGDWVYLEGFQLDRHVQELFSIKTLEELKNMGLIEPYNESIRKCWRVVNV